PVCAVTADLSRFTRFLLNHPATSPIYTLSLHDALPISLHRHECRDHPEGRSQGERGEREAARGEGDHQRGPPGQLVSDGAVGERSEEHTSELQSRENLVCRLLLEKKKKNRHVHNVQEEK